jgi:hypothetical protein
VSPSQATKPLADTSAIALWSAIIRSPCPKMEIQAETTHLAQGLAGVDFPNLRFKPPP